MGTSNHGEGDEGGGHEGDEDREHEGEEGGGPDEGDEVCEHEGEEGGGPRHEGDEDGEHEGEEGGGPHEGDEVGEHECEEGGGPHEGHEVSSWDGAFPLVRSGSLVRATAPVCGRLHTLVERGRHVPSLWTVEHGLLYVGSVYTHL